MKPKNTIKNWAKDDRPREKLILHGTARLSSSELLAILIGNGTARQSALDLGKEILQLGNYSLTELGKMTIADLTRIRGIGTAKAVTICAALELGRRRHADLPNGRAITAGSKQIGAYLRTILQDHSHEVFVVLYLNQNNNIIHYETVSEGGITGTVADPRIILRKALEKNAVGIILSHNHPSGNLSPSRSDAYLTNKIKEAAGFFDIKVIDHIIVSDEGYYSFADEGLL